MVLRVGMRAPRAPGSGQGEEGSSIANVLEEDAFCVWLVGVDWSVDVGDVAAEVPRGYLEGMWSAGWSWSIRSR